jgi:hypothetical protein
MKAQNLDRIAKIQSIIASLKVRATKSWLESNKAFYAFQHLNGPAVYMKPEKRARHSEVRIAKLKKLLEIV